MSSFGIPLGVVFAMILDNIALFDMGLPLGMAAGMGLGTHLDNKANQEGRQLDVGLQPE